MTIIELPGYYLISVKIQQIAPSHYLFNSLYVETLHNTHESQFALQHYLPLLEQPIHFTAAVGLAIGPTA